MYYFLPDLQPIIISLYYSLPKIDLFESSSEVGL